MIFFNMIKSRVLWMKRRRRRMRMRMRRRTMMMRLGRNLDRTFNEDADRCAPDCFEIIIYDGTTFPIM
jgi:hypothetical protein